MRRKMKGTRSLTWAACAMAMAAAVSPGSAPSQEEAVEQIQRYCSTSWQRAGIDHQDWDDCTQDTIAELLDRIGQAQLPLAVGDPSSPERQELKRSVWCTVKRWQRNVRTELPIDETGVTAPEPGSTFPCSWQEALDRACDVISPRQQQILTLLSSGWDIGDIADRLHMSSIQVSRSKYKAIRKLRDVLSGEQAAG